MKSTEVQTLGTYPVSCAFIGHVSRCSCTPRSPVSCGCYAGSTTFCLLVNSSSSPYPLPLLSPKPRATLLQWRLQRRRRRRAYIGVCLVLGGKAELAIRLSILKLTEEKSRREQQSSVRDHKNVPRAIRAVYEHALHFTRPPDMRTRVPSTLIAGLGHEHGLW